MNSNNIFQDKNFATILQEHAREILKYLLQKDTVFSILVSTDFISFNPDLPKEIKSNFHDIILFDIEAYAKESFVLEENQIKFETGFGEENFGSVVSIPIYAIAQIIVEDLPVFTTPIEPTKEQNSRQVFMSNPKNKHLL